MDAFFGGGYLRQVGLAPRSDGKLRESLAEQGLRRAALYSWQSAASETWRILELATHS